MVFLNIPETGNIIKAQVWRTIDSCIMEKWFYLIYCATVKTFITLCFTEITGGWERWSCISCSHSKSGRNIFVLGTSNYYTIIYLLNYQFGFVETPRRSIIIYLHGVSTSLNWHFIVVGETVLFWCLGITCRDGSISRESSASLWRFLKVYWKFSQAGWTTRLPEVLYCEIFSCNINV